MTIRTIMACASFVLSFTYSSNSSRSAINVSVLEQPKVILRYSNRSRRILIALSMVVVDVDPWLHTVTYAFASFSLIVVIVVDDITVVVVEVVVVVVVLVRT